MPGPTRKSKASQERPQNKSTCVIRRTEHSPILIDRAVVEQVESFKFLGVHITNKLEWSKHNRTVVKRARQSLFPLRKLKRFGMGPEILKRFYSWSMTGCITAWYGNCSASDRKTLQRVVRTAQHITGAKLPAIQDLYTRRCQRKALKIVKDPSHPSHRLFSLLPHGKQYQSAKSRTKRLLNSFYPQVIRLLNRPYQSTPPQHHLIRLPAALVREMSSLQPDMGALISIIQTCPSLIFEEGAGANLRCHVYQWGSGNDLTSCLPTNGRRWGEQN
ncbi:uncharacterized protein hmgcll1 isoform X3 [Oncorhynchus mykiss]|nr:uncharacterized protein hmgcll1 isoform X3 [Oncorhynchus mykiss]